MLNMMLEAMRVKVFFQQVVNFEAKAKAAEAKPPPLMC